MGTENPTDQMRTWDNAVLANFLQRYLGQTARRTASMRETVLLMRDTSEGALEAEEVIRQLQSYEDTGQATRRTWLENEHGGETRDEERTMPELSGHPIIESIRFRVNQGETIETEAGIRFRAEKVVVEKRPGGVMMIVTGPARSGFGSTRTVRYNIVGYGERREPPQWLMDLWAEARKRANSMD